MQLFLCGDVMTGRGIDQILPHPSDPTLHEPYINDARAYVQLAEQENGEIRKPVAYDYIWGEALKVLEARKPDLRLINLETSITASDRYWPGKGIHYRMHPGNIPSLTAADIDGAVLANNHVLDWGYPGLLETLEVLKKAGIFWAGAGENRKEASEPALFRVGGKRLLLFAFGATDSGIPREWEASEDQPGVRLLPDFSGRTASFLAEEIGSRRDDGDLVIASIHWGGNWGYEIPPEHRSFAHRLIDLGAVDLIHGHSSHHVKPFEIYRRKLILYGCGDFLNDYEGISGREGYRSDLSGMFLPELDESGDLIQLEIVPLLVEKMQLRPASREDSRWLFEALNRVGQSVGTRVRLDRRGSLRIDDTP